MNANHRTVVPPVSAPAHPYHGPSRHFVDFSSQVPGIINSNDQKLSVGHPPSPKTLHFDIRTFAPQVPAMTNSDRLTSKTNPFTRVLPMCQGESVTYVSGTFSGLTKPLLYRAVPQNAIFLQSTFRRLSLCPASRCRQVAMSPL
jgi:hypothetical protein